jgi:hypothetical protein
MSMIEIHSAALNGKVASYHEFLARYSRHSKVVYGFVEGKEDPCFYRNFLELALPDDWEVELWPAGNKEQVYRIHGLINWRRFSKNRICFFVDRDLSDVIPEPLRSDRNIYVTTGYSIENDVVTKAVCKRVLTELCGFSCANHADLESIGTLFEQELDKFFHNMAPIMAWIVMWRRSGKKPNLNDILMRDLFALKNGCLQVTPSPKGKASAAVYIHEQCNIPFDPAADASSLVAVLGRKSKYRLLIRGKYVLWFLIEFCNSVHRDAVALFPDLEKAPPKMNVTLALSNGMALVGTRARIPKSLRIFLASTFYTHVERVGAIPG